AFVAGGLKAIAARCDAAIAQLVDFAQPRTSGSDTPSPLPSPGGRGGITPGSSTPVEERAPNPPLPPGEGMGEGTSKRRAASAPDNPSNPFSKYLALLREHRSTLSLWQQQLDDNGLDALAAEVSA